MPYIPRIALLLACCYCASTALATVDFVEHTATNQVYGEPSGVTLREPAAPREDEPVDLWVQIGYSFYYTDVAVYYTTDGSTPGGGFGIGTGSTQVLRGNGGAFTQVAFVRNEPSGPGNIDWWKTTLPAPTRAYGITVKYRIGVWHTGGGPEIFANNAGCSDNVCDNPAAPVATFSYSVKLAWPGAGAGQPSPAAGYPPVSFWKEEAVIGNTYTAAMLDQNGTYYDMHFPTPGGIQGVGTKNEGYVDGLDTFPAGLPLGWRGQMHLNQAMPGLRVEGLTHWLSNPSAVSFTNVEQHYYATSNTVITTQRLTTDGGAGHITIEQSDFSPLGAAIPTTPGGQPIRHLCIKRLKLTYVGPTGGSTKAVNVYWYMDPALNGGDNYDAMFFDAARGVMCAYDKTTRTVTGTGVSFTDPNEYNPTTSAGYLKNIALYLGAAMKTTTGGGPFLPDNWRDTSSDNGQGWIGARLVLTSGAPQTIDFLMAGGHFRPDPLSDPMPVADGVYDDQIARAADWFYATDMGAVLDQTNTYWTNWLGAGVTVDTPDDAYDNLLKRGLLATALHLDTVNGGVIAGFHNGAYPYVWPRDAVYAAVCLARTGHYTEADAVYRWMKETCYRDFESWGRKGFWKQKYSTDGYVIWGAPQIDETAVFPWGVYYQYKTTGDASVLSNYIEQVRDAVRSCSEDSFDSRLRYEEAFGLMYSNNVWEDSYDTFVYSNANVVRGLRDAASIFSALGLGGEAADATSRANTIKTGLDGRLDWDGENTDISQLGIVYPFDIYAANDFRAARVVDRMNGVRKKFNDTFCCTEPLVNFAGEFQDLINRYWGDSYWNGGPWFLSTAWYGLYYAARQDVTPGKGDIDNHKHRLDLLIARLGPLGFGAEQIAPAASLTYPGQGDFVLQTAWPNAWESMSTFVDAVMVFLDMTPDAPGNTLRIEPKLPTGWPQLTFNNVHCGAHRVNITASEEFRSSTHTFTNLTGSLLNIDTFVRIPTGYNIIAVTRNGVPIPYTPDYALGRVRVQNSLATGANAVTTIRVRFALGAGPADLNCDGFVNNFDIDAFVVAILSQANYQAQYPSCDYNNADIDGDGFVNNFDIDPFVDCILVGACP